MAEVFGSKSGEMSTSVTGSGSIPGIAKVSGTVGAKVGVESGAKNGVTSGVLKGSKTEYGAHMNGSKSEAKSFGSTTVDSASKSVGNTYGVQSQKTLSSQTAVTKAQSDSVTFEMSGASSVSEGVIKGDQKSWTETWTTSSQDTTLLALKGKVPKGRCAVIYRQSVRYTRRAQLYSYDLCGVRSLMGELVFNEWSWSPNIAISDHCDTTLPPSTQPKAACFASCE
jgi:hypothetical protein